MSTKMIQFKNVPIMPIVEDVDSHNSVPACRNLSRRYWPIKFLSRDENLDLTYTGLIRYKDEDNTVYCDLELPEKYIDHQLWMSDDQQCLFLFPRDAGLLQGFKVFGSEIKNYIANGTNLCECGAGHTQFPQDHMRYCRLYRSNK